MTLIELAARSTHVYGEINLPGESTGEENEYLECIAADVFLGWLVIDLLTTNLVLIALVADILFWVAGEIGCSCTLGRAVFRLFGNTDIDITVSGAIGVD